MSQSARSATGSKTIPVIVTGAGMVGVATVIRGHRPAPSDSVPIIDQVPNVAGVFIGCGHQHVGVTGSARTGQVLAERISGRLPQIDMTPFRIDRFGLKAHRHRARITSARPITAYS